MILDSLQNAAIYRKLGKRFELAFDALASGVSDRVDGKYKLDGVEVHAIVQRYQTKPIEQGKWEAHRQYIDVQYICSGAERMRWELISKMHVTDPYDAARDVEFFSHTGGTVFDVHAGMFAIFYPHDGHMPSLQINGSVQVCKTVVKIAV